MRKLNILIAALSMGLGAAVFYFSRNLTAFDEYGVPGESFWPHLIAWFLIGLGLLQLIEVFVFPAVNAGVTVRLASPAVVKGYVGAAVALIAATLMSWLGFIVAALFLLPSVMVVMGERRPVPILLVSVIAVTVIWLFFQKLFNITLPASIFFES